MPTPQEKLAESLQAVHDLQSRGVVAIRSSALSRTDRERLVANGFLREVMKGWYIPSRPDEARRRQHGVVRRRSGTSAPRYLADRFGAEWCLSPEQSLSLHGGNRAVPAQLLVRAPKGGNKPTPLPHGTSLFDVRNAMPSPNEMVQLDGLRLFSVPAALIAVSAGVLPARIDGCARGDGDREGCIRCARAACSKAVTARSQAGLPARFGAPGRQGIADDIVKTMEKAGYTVRETDPFEEARHIYAGPTRERVTVRHSRTPDVGCDARAGDRRLPRRARHSAERPRVPEGGR